jgi:hypothetical protein
MNDLHFTYPPEVKWGSDVARLIVSLSLVVFASLPHVPFYARALFGIGGLSGVVASLVALRYGIVVAPRELKIEGDVLVGQFRSGKEIRMKLKSIDLIQDIGLMYLWSQYTIKISSSNDGSVLLVGRYLRGLGTLVRTIREYSPHCVVITKFKA